MLLRLHTDPHVTTALWLTLAIVVLVAGFARALAARRSGNECAAVAIVGLVGVAISPVSWIHHLAWVLVAVAVLAGDFRDRTRVVAAVGLGAYFAFRLPWWGNAVSVHHGPLYPTRLVQDAFGLAVLALLFVLPWRELVAGRTGQPLAEIAAVSGRVRPGRERTRGAGSMTVGGGSRAGG
jgi:alpha-1,2-mannosyltransferase